MTRTGAAQVAALCLPFALFLTGCPKAPVYAPQQITAPAAWQKPAVAAPSSFTASPVEDRWWESFHDAQLNGLIARLAAENLDLKTATERIAEARAARRVAHAQALPSAGAGASFSHSRMSPNSWLSLVEPAPGTSTEYNLYTVDVAASWDPDFFGRIRHEVEAAQAGIESSEQQRQAIALIAATELTSRYIQLRGLQASEAIVRNQLELAGTTEKLVQQRFDNGVATRMDLANVRAQKENIEALLPGIATAQAEAINAIGLLLGQQPRALEAELRPVKSQLPTPPSVPVGLPGDLVRRRPDVRQAETQLHIATAEIGVAVADFYPHVTLSGDVGVQGLQPLNPFTLASRTFNVGPSISVPLFRGGALHGALELRQAQQREAVIGFQKTLLSAWKEVDDSMTGFVQAQQTRQHLERAAAQAQTALEAAEQNYREGETDLLNVLVARQTLLQTQSALVRSQTEINLRLTQLYESLGGGWQSVLAPTATTPAAAH